MVVEAREMVDDKLVTDPKLVEMLNSLGYAEAAELVYGEKVEEWKKRHQKPSTDAQMETFNASKPLQAKHDKKLLEKRTTVPLSDVCCQLPPPPKSRKVSAYQPPSLPDDLPWPLQIGILTVSDRAAAGEYKSGDLSGPAVQRAVEALAPDVSFTTAIVPDETDQIQAQLNDWKDQQHIVLTTGGTGMAARDTTPEATQAVLDVELQGLMHFITTECSAIQPLAALTRGTAGSIGKTIVANLPGNPAAVEQMVPLLFSLLLHAWKEL